MAIVDSQLGLGQQPTLVQSQSGLRADGIGKSFNKRRVVRNVSIKLNRGEAVGLLGPNGAVKPPHSICWLVDRLMRAVSLLTGRMSPPCQFSSAPGLAWGICHRSQAFSGPDCRTKYPCRLETLDDSDDERDATLDELMAEFGITHLRNTPSVNLSGGEQAG